MEASCVIAVQIVCTVRLEAHNPKLLLDKCYFVKIGRLLLLHLLCMGRIAIWESMARARAHHDKREEPESIVNARRQKPWETRGYSNHEKGNGADRMTKLDLWKMLQEFILARSVCVHA